MTACRSALPVLLLALVTACNDETAPLDGQASPQDAAIGADTAINDAATNDRASVDVGTSDGINPDGRSSDAAPPPDAAQPLPPQTRAIVVAANYVQPVGELWSVNLGSRAATMVVSGLSQDPVVRYAAGRIIIVNRLAPANGNNVSSYDPTSFQLLQPQCAMGPNSNPQDVVIVPSPSTRAIIPLQGVPALRAVDLANCSQLETTDVSSLDADMNPDLNGAWYAPSLNRIYVALGRYLPPPSYMSQPPARLAYFDAVTLQLGGTLDLATVNPAGWFVKRPMSNEVCIATPADFTPTSMNAGGIDCFYENNGTTAGSMATGAMLGGYVTGFAFSADGMTGYAAVNRTTNPMGPQISDLVTFAVRGSSVRTCTDGTKNITNVAVNDRGEVWATDQTTGASGLRVFSANCTELTSQPVRLGTLPPAFSQNVVFIP